MYPTRSAVVVALTLVVVPAVLLVPFAATQAIAAADPVAKCRAAKMKAAAKKYASKAQCHIKASTKGTDVDVACLQKAETKFEEAVVKAEKSVDCKGETVPIEISVDACIANLVDQVLPAVGDACTDATDCGGPSMVCRTTGFPDGYCTQEGCPSAGSTAGCPSSDSVCHDPAGPGTNYCVDRCPTDEIGTQGSCRPGYTCLDMDPSAATTGGCLPT